VTSWRELARAVATDVAAGTLAPGAPAQPLRRFAQVHAASQATALRAYRELADAGILETAERRVARVAADGPLAAARYLQGAAVFRLASDADPVLADLVDACGPGLERIDVEGSAAALRAVAEGRADGAAISLWHASGAYNAPYARGLVDEPVLVHLWTREQGLLLAPGNPRRVAGGRDLGGLRVARRPIGSGDRSLLDRVTAAAGIVLDASDPEVRAPFDACVAVASGSVDATLGSRAAAEALGLAFVPLAVEPVDIVTTRPALPGLEPLRRLLADAGFRARIAGQPGHDPAEAGVVTSPQL
jgi:molybdate-binding protein